MEYIETSKRLAKDNKRLQSEFKKNLADLKRLFREIRANLPNWTVVHSCSLFQSENIGVAAAGQADFGGEEFLERNAFG